MAAHVEQFMDLCPSTTLFVPKGTGTRLAYRRHRSHLYVWIPPEVTHLCDSVRESFVAVLVRSSPELAGTSHRRRRTEPEQLTRYKDCTAPTDASSIPQPRV